MARGDNELPKINISSFVGGESIDPKNGGPGGFWSSQAMDFRQKSSQMTVLPGLRTLDSSKVLKDKITAMDQDLDGTRYGVGDQGYIYKIDTNDVITVLGQMTSAGGAGMVYNPQNDNLYMSSQQSVSLYGQTGQPNPQFRAGQFGASASVAPGVIYTFNNTTSSYDGGTVNGVATQRNNLNTLTIQGVTPQNYTSLVTNTLTNTTVIPWMSTSPDAAPPESPGQFCAFIPDIEPFASVAVWVTTIGTGSWTLTMHDSMNNKLAAVTIPHAQITTGWNLFKFPTPGVRAFVNAIASANGATGYHFHLTTDTQGDTAAVATISANDLTGTNFVLFAHRLVATKNGWHPMCIFNQYLCIGNGNYLSVYNFGNDGNPNNSQWIRHMLFFDVGMEVTALTVSGTNLIITAEKRSKNSSRNYQEGYMYTWDGINGAPNQKIPITVGAPYAASSINNVVYLYTAGSLYAWGAGTSLIKARYMAYQNTDYLGMHDNTVINPNMMDTRYGIGLMAYPTSTTNPNFDMGIYSWGAVELAYPNSYGFSYALSNGKTRASGGSGADAWTNLQIGMIKNFVDTLYASWQYTDAQGVVHYGLDITDNTSDPAPVFKWQALLWDGGAVYKQKQAMRVLVSFLPLPTGVEITGWYSLDRGDQVSVDDDQKTYFTAKAGDESLLINIPGGRCREIQVGFNGTIKPGSVTPTILGVTTEIQPFPDENDLRPYSKNGV